jgi:hypothetical protein
MGWIVVSETWLFFRILVAVVYPIVDGRKVLSRAFTLFYQSLSSKQIFPIRKARLLRLLQRSKGYRLRLFLCKTVQGFWESQSDQ